MSGTPCEEIRAAGPELALGVLDGAERARVLEHAPACPACRAHLAELAVVAQEVLAAAPDHEPPPGFESRVLDLLQPRPARRRRWRLLLVAAAAVLIVAGAATWATLSATREERDLAAQYRGVLAKAGGDYFIAADLRDAAGRKRGLVFAYQGERPWLTVVLDAGVGSDPRDVVIATRAGDTRALGRFRPAIAGRIWARALPVAVHDVASVHLGGDLRALLPKSGG